MKNLLLLITSLLLLYACHNEIEEDLRQQSEIKLRSGSSIEEIMSISDLIHLDYLDNVEASEKRMRKAILKLSQVLMLTMQDSMVKSELYHTLTQYVGKNTRYIGLIDLLNFNNSKQYSFSNVPDNVKGSFKSRFMEIIGTSPTYYSEINYFINNSTVESSNFFDFAQLYLYMPYIENRTLESFNPIIVPSTKESNSSNGFRLLGGNNAETFSTSINALVNNFEMILVNDDVAEEEGAIIITSGNPDGPNGISCDCDVDEDGDGYCDGTFEESESLGVCFDSNDQDPCVPRSGHPHCGYDSDNNGGGTNSRGDEPDPNSCEEDYCDHNRAVWIGILKLTEQFDRLISLDGNGGDSEINIIWTAKPSINSDGEVELSEDDFQHWPRTYSRKELRTDAAVWIGHQLEGDWACDEEKRYFIVYEHDNDSEKKFSFGGTWTGPTTSVEVGGFTFSLPEQEFNGKFEVTIPGANELIVQRTFEEETFFCNNVNNIDGCGLHDPPQFPYQWGPAPYLTPFETTIYNCNTMPGWYTLPHGFQEK